MFLLNEIVEDLNKHKLPIDEVLNLYDITHEPLFKKGDSVYFEDMDLSKLYLFFQMVMFENNSYNDFINYKTLYDRHKSIFQYVNCVGKINKIKVSKFKLKKGSISKKKYAVEIVYPDGNILIINNLKYLKLYLSVN